MIGVDVLRAGSGVIHRMFCSSYLTSGGSMIRMQNRSSIGPALDVPSLIRSRFHPGFRSAANRPDGSSECRSSWLLIDGYDPRTMRRSVERYTSLPLTQAFIPCAWSATNRTGPPRGEYRYAWA